MNVKRIDSAARRVNKYVFGFRQHAVAEAVLYKYPTYEDRASSAAQRNPAARLAAASAAGDAFVDLWLVTDRRPGPAPVRGSWHQPEAVKRCQIMFMNAGEPLLNFNGLADAIPQNCTAVSALCAAHQHVGAGWDYERVRAYCRGGSDRRPAIQRARKHRPETRDALIPFKAKLNLWQIGHEAGMVFCRGTAVFVLPTTAPDDSNTSHEARCASSDCSIRCGEATISVVCERDESVAARPMHGSASWQPISWRS